MVRQSPARTVEAGHTYLTDEFESNYREGRRTTMSETCSLCGEVFGSVTSLVEHENLAHSHDDQAQDVEMNPETHRAGLVCALCGRRFPTPQALAAHNLRPHPAPERRPRPGPVPV